MTFKQSITLHLTKDETTCKLKKDTRKNLYKHINMNKNKSNSSNQCIHIIQICVVFRVGNHRVPTSSEIILCDLPKSHENALSWVWELGCFVFGEETTITGWWQLKDLCRMFTPIFEEDETILTGAYFSIEQ